MYGQSEFDLLKPVCIWPRGSSWSWHVPPCCGTFQVPESHSPQKQTTTENFSSRYVLLQPTVFSCAPRTAPRDQRTRLLELGGEIATRDRRHLSAQNPQTVELERFPPIQRAPRESFVPRSAILQHASSCHDSSRCTAEEVRRRRHDPLSRRIWDSSDNVPWSQLDHFAGTLQKPSFRDRKTHEK